MGRLWGWGRRRVWLHYVANIQTLTKFSCQQLCTIHNSAYQGILLGNAWHEVPFFMWSCMY